MSAVCCVVCPVGTMVGSPQLGRYDGRVAVRAFGLALPGALSVMWPSTPASVVTRLAEQVLPTNAVSFQGREALEEGDQRDRASCEDAYDCHRDETDKVLHVAL